MLCFYILPFLDFLGLCFLTFFILNNACTQTLQQYSSFKMKLILAILAVFSLMSLGLAQGLGSLPKCAVRLSPRSQMKQL